MKGNYVEDEIMMSRSKNVHNEDEHLIITTRAMKECTADSYEGENE